MELDLQERLKNFKDNQVAKVQVVTNNKTVKAARKKLWKNQADPLQQLRDLKRLEVNSCIENVRFTVVFNIPVNPNNNEYITKLLQAATAIATIGLDVHSTEFQLPACMRPGK